MSGGSEDLKETKNELDIYLLDKIEPHIRNPLGFEWEILDWWKTNSSRYPVLACMAKDILAIPVSTVASESAFSTGGRILDQYRSSPTHKTVEALILTQDWLRSSLCYDGTNIFRQLKEENDILHAVTEEMQNVAAAGSASGSF
ncbi:putative AC9 transposase [Cardamine amara subsp. amara]|uniref:AC9 transposase n=1 Tax=Cardamine amara subsp. amara TaxID=228776 RepID=A0ABD1BGK0_CARAN